MWIKIENEYINLRDVVNIYNRENEINFVTNNDNCIKVYLSNKSKQEIQEILDQAMKPIIENSINYEKLFNLIEKFDLT